MQDIHSMAGGGGGGGGPLFSSTANSGIAVGGGGIDRRMRAHNLQSQALKCPRCDSLNTKFCYYNNYNLSQPRHFCKNCRRYWTKGGVLRNVPVGGGCRKSTKRTPSSSKSKQTPPASTATETAIPTAEEGEKSNNSHSSSDSSSLTTTKTTAADAVSSQQPQENNNTSHNSNSIFSFPDSSSSKYLFPTSTRSYENQFSCTTMFPEMGSFTNLMSDNFQLPDICNTPTPNPPPPCTTTNTLQSDTNLQFPPSISRWNNPEANSIITAPSIAVPNGFLDQIDLQQNNDGRNISNGEAFTQFDWQQGGTNGGSGGFFDLPSTTVDQAYWSQNQWSDNNDHHNLYLP